MVKITIEDTDYNTDNMTDEQKGLTATLHQGQKAEEKLKEDLESANYAIKCIQAMGKAQTTRLKALLDDGKKE
jgi:hypothetical protein